ncbi:hypothetical protein PPERSA_09292 [Pseudocohnilembus persalinus]|uniref:Uncharacterized protein n=1 Tax=Pseudocohnilembus persalinus TaxID=266149 RepID=A0A0V0R557_PSEPJ|nr:hypothetical protein PPERSA_09292 [Pseudocohnilembus persalinus]|eukprot:KRX09622.1 hypothetical protein PPERSA_09292 [Pseudocohnilembus persalinus]
MNVSPVIFKRSQSADGKTKKIKIIHKKNPEKLQPTLNNNIYNKTSNYPIEQILKIQNKQQQDMLNIYAQQKSEKKIQNSNQQNKNYNNNIQSGTFQIANQTSQNKLQDNNLIYNNFSFHSNINNQTDKNLQNNQSILENKQQGQKQQVANRIQRAYSCEQPCKFKRPFLPQQGSQEDL